MIIKYREYQKKKRRRRREFDKNFGGTIDTIIMVIFEYCSALVLYYFLYMKPYLKRTKTTH
jgi:hypothetical protein